MRVEFLQNDLDRLFGLHIVTEPPLLRIERDLDVGCDAHILYFPSSQAELLDFSTFGAHNRR